MKAIINTKLIMEEGIIWDGALTYDNGKIVQVGWAKDVTIPEDAEVIDAQRKRLGTKRGFIAVKSNCSLQSYVPALFPLSDYGVKKALVCTYQAISGAGKTFERWPEIIDNVIPFIGGEEEKSEQEPLKIWGKVENGKIIASVRPTLVSRSHILAGVNGVFNAVVCSMEGMDLQLGRLKAAIEEAGGILCITADHGNADRMIDLDGTPFTAHTTNPVPFCVVGYPDVPAKEAPARKENFEYLHQNLQHALGEGWRKAFPQAFRRNPHRQRYRIQRPGHDRVLPS